MYYIKSTSSVSHQPSFQNKGFSGFISPLTDVSELIQPNYKEYIDAGLLRRMSKILRMSVACAIDSLKMAGVGQPDAIVVGTGLGCLLDTEKFLNNVLTLEGMLPPTSFIQSTHNTIAGQISLSLGNHGYNMTHTQNTLSFEHALLDAMLLLKEGSQNILVGAADEHIPFLDEVAENLGLSKTPLTSGTSFFTLSNEPENALAEIVDVDAIGFVENGDEAISEFLVKNGYGISDITRVFAAGGFREMHWQQGVEIFDYLKYSGLYATASAFGLHLALDKTLPVKSLTLVCNQINQSNLGLILLRSIEA